MKISYGYTDATGEYYITVDTDRCSGCGDCIPACPRGLFELHVDDYDQEVVQVKPEAVRKLGFLCPGSEVGKRAESCGVACRAACGSEVFHHSW